MKKYFLLASFTFGLGSQVMASDSSISRVVGFSLDGKFAAVEEYGVQDGSGFAYATYAFLDVDKNSFASDTISTSEDEHEANSDVDKIRAKAAAKSKATLEKLKIVSADALGPRLTLANVNLADSDFDSNRQLKFRLRSAFSKFSYDQGSCNLKLLEKATAGKDFNENDLKIFQLTLDCSKSGETVVSKVLQNDTHLPESRGKPYGYDIESAYIFDPSPYSNLDLATAKILVFVRYKSVGFEGSDLRYLPVAGSFK